MTETPPLPPLNDTQLEALNTVSWLTGAYGSACTNNELPRRRVMALVRRGLVESIGMVERIDESGGATERYAEGFIPTDAGCAILDAVDWL